MKALLAWLSSLAWHRERVATFWMDTAEAPLHPGMERSPDGWRLRAVTGPGELDADALFGNGELAEEFRRFLGQGHLVFLGEVSGRPVFYGKARTGPRRVSLWQGALWTSLGATDAVIEYFNVHPDVLYRGIYPLALRDIVNLLRDRSGIRRIVCATRTSNRASFNGVVGYGFRVSQETTVLRILGLNLSGGEARWPA